MLFDVLSDEFFSDHSWFFSSSPTAVTFLNSACTLGLPSLCFQSVQFLETNISQGSVATPLRCAGICNECITANFLPSVTVKEIGKSIDIWQRYGQEFGVFFDIDVYLRKL